MYKVMIGLLTSRMVASSPAQWWRWTLDRHRSQQWRNVLLWHMVPWWREAAGTGGM